MPLWEWYKTPEAALARERATKAMVGVEGFLQGGLIYDYHWEKHGQEAAIVDVGGGLGGAAIELCRRFPKIKVIPQAAPKVRNTVSHTTSLNFALIRLPPSSSSRELQFWEENAPECKLRVTSMSHDFFGPQIQAFMRFFNKPLNSASVLSIVPANMSIYMSTMYFNLLFFSSRTNSAMHNRPPSASDGITSQIGLRIRRQFLSTQLWMTKAEFRIFKIHRNRASCALIEAVAV